ncbi:MAG: hypothetical protein H0U60_06650 [Blastocatellia bacterium]|nr:hypothetical protein [Blastocatellia bacterium]
MDWMKELSGVLQQYNGAGAAPAKATVNDDFDQVAQTTPPAVLADGLAAAFRSDETPEFGHMAAQLFNNSDGQQRAGILNTLLRTAGPLILSQILSRQTQSEGGGGLSNLIDLLKGGNETEVTPEQAEQIPAGAVEEIAAQAEKKDPSVIDQVSQFYAEHPTLVKTLGAAALTIAVSQIAKRQQR